jgi:hypothetical protein
MNAPARGRIARPEGMMRQVHLIAALAATLLLACGGDDDGNMVGDDDDDAPDGGGDVASNPGFDTTTLTALPLAYSEEGGVWESQGPADWSCLDTATEDVPTEIDVLVTGDVNDFQTGDPIPGAAITAYDGVDFAGQGVASTTSNEQGEFSLTLPAGVGRINYKIVNQPDWLDTYLLNQYYEPNEAEQGQGLDAVSIGTANVLPAFIGVTRTEGTGVLAGAIRDCNENEVQGVLATVSAVSCADDPACAPDHLAGAATYYFSAAATSLPVRHNVASSTNKDGLFVVIELPPAPSAYLQVWGYTTEAELEAETLHLIAEIPAPVLADSVITASMEPYRTQP